MICKLAVSIGLLLAGVQAQQAANCQYQSLKCGSVLLNPPYSKFEKFNNILKLSTYVSDI